MNKIDCPFCGLRDAEEFHYGGDATKPRPELNNPSQDDWMDYVYERDNPSGFHREFWYHASGCRSWLVVERHMKSHEMRSIKLASDGGSE